jgi:predicted transcriptional regulator
MKDKVRPVVPESADCQRDMAVKSSAAKGIRQGLEDAKAGRTRPAQTVFAALRAEYAIPRREP